VLRQPSAHRRRIGLLRNHRRQHLPQPQAGDEDKPAPDHIELARSTEEEEQSQLKRLHDFHHRHAGEGSAMLDRVKRTLIDNGNVFEVLTDAVRFCSLGQITSALFEVGGQYRRNM
jgi:methylmalonyl-CoA mutase